MVAEGASHLEQLRGSTIQATRTRLQLLYKGVPGNTIRR